MLPRCLAWLLRITKSFVTLSRFLAYLFCTIVNPWER